jgi:protein-tyrosine phosphatase
MSGPVFEILPRQLYLSGTWQKFSQDRALREINSRKITNVVNLGKADVAWDLRLRQVNYEYHKVPDSKLSVPAEYVGEIAKRMAAVINNGGCVLSMCYGGRNRSALLAGLILHELGDYTGPSLVDLILHVRPAALINEGYRRHLLSLE